MRMSPLHSVLLLLIFTATAAAQPVLNLKRAEMQWPDLTVHYDIRCGGLLDFSHGSGNLALFEDGIPVALSSMYCPDTTVHCPPSVTLVLDASADMVGKWHAGVVKAGNAFVDKMDGAVDEAAIMYFNSAVSLQQGMTTQKAPLRSALLALFPVGDRLLFDGAYSGITHTASAGVNGCRAVVLAAVGQDMQSSYTEADVIAHARASDVHVITVGMSSAVDAASLQRIADSTGGAYFPVLDTLNISKAFREVFEFISDEFRECRMTYTSDCPDGAEHELRVDVSGVCSGTDSKTLKFNKPQLPTQTQIIDLFPGVSEGFEGQQLTVHVTYLMLQPGVLHPSDIIISFPEHVLQLMSVSIPSLSPLNGTGVDIIPYAGNYLIGTRQAVQTGLGGPFFNLEFYVKERADSISITIDPIRSVMRKGCVRPVFHQGTVNIAVPPDPEIEALGATSFCPGDSVILRTVEEYDSYVWTTGDTTRSIVASDSGNYAVTVMDHAGRTALSSLFHVEVYPGADPELSNEGLFSLCAGRSLNVTTKQPYVSYNWSTGDTTSSITVTDAGMYTVEVVDANGCTGISDTLYVVLDDPVVTIQPADTALLCSGGSTTLTAAAGFAQYRWSNGRTGQQLEVTQPGMYSVMVTNAAGCTAQSDTVIVVTAQSPVADITAVGPLTICPGDTLWLDGGADFAAYEWSTGADTRRIAVTDTGSYWLRVTGDNGCLSLPDVINIGYTRRPSINPSGTYAFCYGEDLTIEAPAGYVQYMWSTGETTQNITVDTSGVFWVDVLDAGGCLLRSDSTELYFRPEVQPDVIVHGDLRFCEGDSVRLEVPAGFTSYRWNTGETHRILVVRDAGTYNVEVFTQDGCQGFSEDVVVTVLPLPDKPVITRLNNLLSCSLAESYQWYYNGIAVKDGTERNLGVATSGVYTVVVTNANGCSRESDPIDVQLSTGVESLPDGFAVAAWPDPNKGLLQVRVDMPAPSALRITVVNLLGQQVAHFASDRAQPGSVQHVDLSSVPAGMYLLRVQAGTHMMTRRIIRR
ncbi:T9SS type A sorting domain-containing protein [bacterium]|nr:T9SS type A sorting domain-containing protein [bacterium]